MDLTTKQCMLIMELCWERTEHLKDRIKFLSSPEAPTFGPGDDPVIPYIQKGIEEINEIGRILDGYMEGK